MRLATWNVNGLRARLDYLLHWLRDRRPDVVGLQELKMTDDLFPTEVFEAEGYQTLTHGQKAWNGVAVLTREPAELVQKGLPGQDDFGARLISVQLEALRFTTVYCPNGKTVEHDDYPRKLAWFEDLATHVGDTMSADTPALLCGDFNICPQALDSFDEAGHEGAIFHTEAERTQMRALYDCGLHDVFRERNPDLQAFSWWDYRAGSFQRNKGLRIDFMLATAPVLERVTAVEIDRDYRKKKEGLTASDHAPVMVDIS